MIKSCAEKVTSFLVCNETIESDEFEIYVYGFETLIAFIVNISVILAISIVFDKFIQTILFLSCYCPIRQFSGGYHADNYKKCLGIFVKIYLINISIISFISNRNLDGIIIIGTLISYLGIWRLAPIEHRNNPLSKKEINHYKKIVRILTSIVLLLVGMGIRIDAVYEYTLYISSAIVWIYIMLKLANINIARRINI
ncbi:MAG: accessory gene regulator B family protein [Peptostreptococcaceae bacterium]|nr:accessory gene regulator B family protein [Peptostreptococcaceae bacterium]